MEPNPDNSLADVRHAPSLSDDLPDAQMQEIISVLPEEKQEVLIRHMQALIVAKSNSKESFCISGSTESGSVARMLNFLPLLFAFHALYIKSVHSFKVPNIGTIRIACANEARSTRLRFFTFTLSHSRLFAFISG